MRWGREGEWCGVIKRSVRRKSEEEIIVRNG
jgi:hypothetical protein